MAGSTLASPTAEAAAAAGGRKGRRFSLWAEAWRRFRRHRLAFAGAVVFILILLSVCAGPFMWTLAVNDIDFSARLASPSWAHPFGTDDLGQDLLARMLYGGRISIAVGLAAMSVSVIVGTIVGAVAGMS